MSENGLITQPLSSWAGKSITWATFVDDLRIRTDLQSVDRPDRHLLRELKALSLFHGQSILIPDSHLCGNYIMQSLYLAEDTGIREAFRQGLLVLAIRESRPEETASLAAVNERVGKRRAFPAKLNQARAFARQFDREQGLEQPCASWSLQAMSGGFERLIDKLVRQGDRLLTADNCGVLSDARDAAKRIADGGAGGPVDYFRFGDLYNYLRTSRGMRDTDPTIRAANAAYLLNPGIQLDVPVSVPLSCVPTEYVNFLIADDASSLSRFGGSTVIPELDIAPLEVLTDESLDRVTFPTIRACQAAGHACGYFRALDHARARAGTDQEWQAFNLYIQALSEYVKEIKGIAPSLDTVTADEYVHQASAKLDLLMIDKRKRWWGLLAWCVPLVVSGGGTFLGLSAYGVTGLQLFTAALTSSSLGAAVGNGVAKFVQSGMDERISQLQRLVGGTMKASKRK